MRTTTSNYPQCPSHPAAHMSAGKTGWECSSCGKERQRYGEISADAFRALTVDVLPSVLAIPLDHLVDERHPVVQLFHMCEAVELALRLSFSLSLAELRGRAGDALSAMQPSLSKEIKTPTLGVWANLTKAAVKQMGEEPIVAELPKWVDQIDRLLQSGEKTPEASFSILRNTLAHGGITKTAAERYLDCHASAFCALFSQPWLGELKLIGRRPNGEYCRLRGSGSFEIASVSDAPENIIQSIDAGGLAILQGGHWFELYPLHFYGMPIGLGKLAPRVDEPSAQVYRRRESASLQQTPVGCDQLSISVVHGKAVEDFDRLFAANEPEPDDCLVPGHEAELASIASEFRGRTQDLAYALEKVTETREGVLWLWGHPGAGKSFFIAKLATEMIEKLPSACVVPYRFGGGKGGASSNMESFATVASHRIRAWLAARGLGEVVAKVKHGTDAYGELQSLIKAWPSERLIFVLDGLDEVSRLDPKFADKVLKLKADGLLWLCAGRNEKPLHEKMLKAKHSSPLFADGLPKMSREDIYELLTEGLGAQVKELVYLDQERDGVVSNPFVDQLAKNADGLPLYVYFVVKQAQRYDISISRAEANKLPQSLMAYQAKLIREVHVEDSNQVRTPLLVTIALALEPISSDALLKLLIRRNLLSDANSGREVLENALGHLDHLIRRVPLDQGRHGFVPFHESLREQLLDSRDLAQAVGTARIAFSQLALDWKQLDGELHTYALKHGVGHLVDHKNAEAASGLLTSFAHLAARVAQGGANTCRQILSEYETVETALDAPAPALNQWHQFWRVNQHCIARGRLTALFQAAMAEPLSSSIADSARSWHESHDGSPKWLRRINCEHAVSSTTASTTASTLTFDDYDSVDAAHPSEPLAATIVDSAIAIWEAETGHRVATVAMDVDDEPTRVAWSPDGQLLIALSSCGHLQLWQSPSWQPHSGPFAPSDWAGESTPDLFAPAIHVQTDEILISCRDLSAVWSIADKCTARSASVGSLYGITYAPDFRHAIHHGNSQRNYEQPAVVWDLETSGRKELGTGSAIDSATFFSDGKRFLACHNDRTIRLWATDGEPVREWKHIKRKTTAVYLDRDEQFAFVIADKYVELIDLYDAQPKAKGKPKPLIKAANKIRFHNFNRKHNRLTTIGDNGEVWTCTRNPDGAFTPRRIVQTPDIGDTAVYSEAIDELITQASYSANRKGLRAIRLSSKATEPTHTAATTEAAVRTVVEVLATPRGGLAWTRETGKSITARSVETGEVKYVLDDQDYAQSVIADAPYLLVPHASGKQVDCFDVESGARLWQYELGWRGSVTPVADRRVVFSSFATNLSEMSCSLAVIGRERPTDPLALELPAAGGQIAFMEFAPLMAQGRRLLGNASFIEDGEALCVWDAASGELLHCEQGEWRLKSFVGTAQDNCVIAHVSRPEASVRLLGVERGKVLRSWPARNVWATPDPTRLLLASGPGNDARELRLQDIGSDSPMMRFGGRGSAASHPAAVEHALYHPDRRRVLSVAGATVSVWDTANGELLRRFDHSSFVNRTEEGAALVAVLGASERVAVACGYDVIIWDLSTGEQCACWYGSDNVTALLGVGALRLMVGDARGAALWLELADH